MAVQARSSRAIASPTSASVTISGGTSRATLSPAADRQELLGTERVDQVAVRHIAFQAEQQALAAHLGDHRRMPVLDLGEPLLEQQRDLRT